MIYAVLILGFLLRLINLNQSFWLDEAITALAVQGNPFIELLTKFSPGDFHPPLYYLFLKLWSNIFGYSEIALRLPSVIFGVVAIGFVYLIGKKLFTSKVGLVAALFLAVNPLAVYYSQEARMYTLAMMLVTGSIWFLLSKRWFWFVIFATASIYTDYLPWLMFPVYFLIVEDKKLFIAHCSLLIAAYLPWLPSFLVQLQTGLSLSSAIPVWSAVLGSFSLKALALTVVKFIFGRISTDNKILYAVIAAIGTGGYLAVVSRNKNKILWSWLLFPILVGWLVSLKVSIFTYFRFLFVLPALPLLLAGGTKKNVATMFVLAISLFSLTWFNTHPEFWREDWRQATKYVETDNSLAIMPSLSQSAPLTYYQLKTPLVDVSKPVVLTGVKTVYLLRYVPEIFDPSDIGQKTIENNGYKLIENKNFNGVVIWKYESRN